MLNRFALRRLLPGLAAAAAAFVVAAGAHAQGYTAIDPPQPTAAGEHIEVLDFFQYGCPHCRAIEPLIERWAEQQPDDVVLNRVPVAFNAGMEPWQRLYYTLEGMGRLDLQAAVFTAVQSERNPLNSRDRIVAWAEEQGLDTDKFGAMFDSFGVQTKVGRANQLIKAYNLQSVPTLVVGGRYLTSPSQANGYQQAVDMAGQLVERVRAEK